VHFLRLLAVGWPGAQGARHNYVVACNFAKCLPIKSFSLTGLAKSLLIWLLTTPPHLKYVATLLCNLSLIGCFLTLKFHKVVCGKLATYARSGGIFNNQLTANLPRNRTVKKFENRLKFARIIAVSLWPCFFDPPCIVHVRMHVNMKTSRWLYLSVFIHIKVLKCYKNIKHFCDTGLKSFVRQWPLSKSDEKLLCYPLPSGCKLSCLGHGESGVYFRTPSGNKSWPRPCAGGGKLRSPSGTTCSVAIVDVAAVPANFSGADRQHVSSRPEINTSRGASRDCTQHTSTRLRPTEIDSRPRTGCKPIIRPIMCKYTVRRPYSFKAQTTLYYYYCGLNADLL